MRLYTFIISYVDVIDEEQRIFLDDNFFILMPNEEKTVKITVDKGEIGKVSVNIWNGDNIIV